MNIISRNLPGAIKTLFLICLLFTFVFGASAQNQQKKYQVACIGFYNLENLFDTIDQENNDADFLPNGANLYTGKVYLDKLQKLSDVISLIATDISPDGPAILGVAEVENRGVLEALAATEKLKSRNYKVLHFDSPDERGVDVGMYYNPRYFQPLSSRPLLIDLKNVISDGRPTRDVLFVSGLLLGEKVHIFVNHWPSRRGGEEASAPLRNYAASVVRSKIDSLLQDNPDAKIVVMGDLNDDPVSPSCAKIIKGVFDKKLLKKGEMYNPWNDYYKEGIGTLAYNDSWNLFDQIIISSAWVLNPQQTLFYQSANIFKKPWMTQQTGRFKGYPKRTYDFNKYIGGYSDHLPTYLIMLKEMP